jgi:hypothetical protein
MVFYTYVSFSFVDTGLRGLPDVAQLFQFEIQFIVQDKNVLVSAWGKNAKGAPIAVHRFT